MADKPVIKVGYLRITDHLILGITKYKIAKGIETFQHLNLEAIAMSGWDYIGDGLANNEINAAFILAPYSMELFHSAQKIKMVLLGHKTGSVIITNKRLNIKNVEDFRGKRILVPLHLSTHFMLFSQMLGEKGMEIGMGRDVEFDVIAPQDMPEVLSWDEDGDIAGFIVAEPFGSQAIKDGYGEEFMLSKDIWPDHPCCVFVVKEEIVEKYPEAIEELCRSFNKSGLIIEQKPENAAKIGSVFLKQDEQLIKKVLTEPIDRIKTGELFPFIKDFDKMQNYMTEKISVLSGKIDLEKFIDTRFAKAVGAK